MAISHKEILEFVSENIGAHKHRYRYVGVSNGKKCYVFMCRTCGFIQYFQKTGVMSVVAGNGKKWRKRWEKNFSWNEIIVNWAREAREREAYELLFGYEANHEDASLA